MVLFSDLFSVGSLANIATILLLAYPSLKWVKKTIETRSTEIKTTLSELKDAQQKCTKQVSDMATRVEGVERKVDEDKSMTRENKDRLESLRGISNETSNKVSNVERITTDNSRNGDNLRQQLAPVLESEREVILKHLRRLDKRMSSIEGATASNKANIAGMRRGNRGTGKTRRNKANY